MTIKTIKTVLFASLIAAMVVPFSMMDVANAASNENTGEKAKERIDAKKQNIKHLGDKMMHSSYKSPILRPV